MRRLTRKYAATTSQSPKVIFIQSPGPEGVLTESARQYIAEEVKQEDGMQHRVCCVPRLHLSLNSATSNPNPRSSEASNVENASTDRNLNAEPDVRMES